MRMVPDKFMVDKTQQEEPAKQIRRHIASRGRSRMTGRMAREVQEFADEELDVEEEKEEKDKKKRKKKEKLRKPNILGGGLALASIVVIFLFLQNTPPADVSVKSAATDTAKVDAETQKSLKELQSGAQTQLDNVKKQAENFNVKDATSPQINKLLDDAEGTKNIPTQIGELVSKHSGGTIESVTGTVARLEKIVRDAEAVKDSVLDAMQKL